MPPRRIIAPAVASDGLDQIMMGPSPRLASFDPEAVRVFLEERSSYIQRLKQDGHDLYL